MLDEIAYLVKRFFHLFFSKVPINPLFLNSVF